MKDKFVIAVVSLLYGSLLIVIIVFWYKKKCQRGRIEDSIPLTAFVGPEQQVITEDDRSILSVAEQELDNLVEEYAKARNYSNTLASVRRKLNFSGEYTY